MSIQLWIFISAGGGNTNYVNLLLEMYCLFRYESSKNLKDAIWNNWLVNVTGELGKWIPDDLLQEHYNRWLEDIVKKAERILTTSFFGKLSHPMSSFFCDSRRSLKLHSNCIKDQNLILLVTSGMNTNSSSHCMAKKRYIFSVLVTPCRGKSF